jgi:hypothetical protein
VAIETKFAWLASEEGNSVDTVSDILLITFCGTQTTPKEVNVIS